MNPAPAPGAAPAAPNQANGEALQKVVLAGQKIMYSPQTFAMFKQGLMKEGTWPGKLALQAAGLIKLLDGKSNGTIPKQVLVPAATALLLDMVEFVNKAGLAKLTAQDVSLAVQLMVRIILHEYGIIGQKKQPQAAPPAPGGGLINQPPAGA